MKNHIIVMQQFLEDRRYEELGSYINNMSERIEIGNEYVCTGHLELDVNQEGKKLKTTKRDKDFYGIGFGNVRRIVYKHHGIMKYSFDKKIFRVNIFLYN